MYPTDFWSLWGHSVKTSLAICFAELENPSFCISFAPSLQGVTQKVCGPTIGLWMNRSPSELSNCNFHFFLFPFFDFKGALVGYDFFVKKYQKGNYKHPLNFYWTCDDEIIGSGILIHTQADLVHIMLSITYKDQVDPGWITCYTLIWLH